MTNVRKPAQIFTSLFNRFGFERFHESEARHFTDVTTEEMLMMLISGRMTSHTEIAKDGTRWLKGQLVDPRK